MVCDVSFLYCRKKLKISKFTVYMCKLANNLLLHFLASDVSKHTILSAIINDKIRIVVKHTELPEVYGVPSVTVGAGGSAVGSRSSPELEFNKAGCLIPPFEVDDYVPGMHTHVIYYDCVFCAFCFVHMSGLVLFHVIHIYELL